MAKRPETYVPWAPVKYDLPDVAAIQALMRGDATEDQQKRALKWIVEKAAGAYQQTYFPGDNGRRDTDFAEGKRFVGNTIIKMTKLNLSTLRKGEGNEIS